MKKPCVAWFVVLTLVASVCHSFAADADSLRAMVKYNHDGLDLTVLLAGRNSIMNNIKNIGPDFTMESLASTTFQRGDQVLPAIIYSTNHIDQDGNADLTYDISVLRPDGTPVKELKQLVILKGRGMREGGYRFLDHPVEIPLGDDMPLGVYEVRIVVCENVKPVKVECNLAFQVTE